MPTVAADVFGCDADHVESGSTPDYKAFPACDATYNAGVYAAKLVRYFEDSTWLSAAIDPTETPAAHEAGALTPAKVRSMTKGRRHTPSEILLREGRDER